MFRSRVDRRLATAVFIDIVDSTRIAADVGDRDWRALLGRFRAVVRRALRTHRGHEEDTAGDGFFATFRSPAAALRAAAAIVTAARDLGLPVRCGLHTGEMERIDGRLGGIAAHIAARVVSLAPPGGIAVTGTVRDLVVGGGITFEPLGESELKGVPGRWALHAVTAIDGRPLERALPDLEAADRRVEALRPATRRSSGVLVAAALVLAAVAVAGVAWRSAATPPGEAVGSPSPSPSGPPLPPVALVRIDAQTLQVTEVVRDKQAGPLNMLTMGGSMWLWDGDKPLIRRSLVTGAVEASQPLPPMTYDVQPGFGSIWIAHDGEDTRLDRVDPISGRRLAQLDPETNLYSYVAGADAIWASGTEWQLIEIDPFRAEIERVVPNVTGGDVYYVAAAGELLYLFGYEGGARVSVFEPAKAEVIRSFEYEMEGFGPVDRNGTMWVLDEEASTVTRVNTVSGEPDRSIGLAGLDDGSTVAFGFTATWVTGGAAVYRISWESRRVITIPMPDGVLASGIGIDEETMTVWVSARAAP